MIPLGNVISGNNKNGIEVTGTASGFVSFNTFAGIFRLRGHRPEQGDGILITSSGGNNLIRTCIVSGNLGNGIELGGNATGVQVTDTAVGTEVTNRRNPRHPEPRATASRSTGTPTITRSAASSRRSNRR